MSNADIVMTCRHRHDVRVQCMTCVQCIQAVSSSVWDAQPNNVSNVKGWSASACNVQTTLCTFLTKLPCTGCLSCLSMTASITYDNACLSMPVCQWLHLPQDSNMSNQDCCLPLLGNRRRPSTRSSKPSFFAVFSRSCTPVSPCTFKIRHTRLAHALLKSGTPG